MTRYWVIAPFEVTDPATFERVWQFDLTNGIISIGWHELGDISSWDKDQIRVAYEEKYGSTSASSMTRTANMLWNFFHEIKDSDVVIARKGRKRLAAVGLVRERAYFSQVGHPECSHPNFLHVQWYESPRDKEYDNRIVFGMQTLYEISEAEYKELIGEEEASEVEETVEAPENRLEFSMEQYLEAFIVENFGSIFGGELEIYTDEQGNIIGQQYRTDVGRIDILAFQPDANSFVVIELKKGRESDKVVGQALRYIGWVSEELCGNGQNVKGLIICGGPDPRLSYAVKATQNIELKYYHINFELSEFPQYPPQ